MWDWEKEKKVLQITLDLNRLLNPRFVYLFSKQERQTQWERTISLFFIF